MGRRLDGWKALEWPARRRLAACAVGLYSMHAALALFGYERTRRLVERGSRHSHPRMANDKDIAEAKALAGLAAIAGRHGPIEVTCLRRSLLLYGWLRRRGLLPSMQLGVAEHDGPFRAHAWVELEGVRLLQSDAGHHPFMPATQR